MPDLYAHRQQLLPLLALPGTQRPSAGLPPHSPQPTDPETRSESLCAGQCRAVVPSVHTWAALHCTTHKSLLQEQRPAAAAEHCNNLLLAGARHSHTALHSQSPNQPALPKAIDCKRSLNPIQMIHLHLGLPSTALAIQGCVCKCCFPFIPVWL